MTTHTPGPWIARDESRPNDDHHTPIRIYQDPATAGGFLLLFEASGDAPADQEAANVRLVAAAPDLLAALRAVLPYAESRLEDMAENAEAVRDLPITGAEAEAQYRKCRDAFQAAQAAVAAVEGSR